MKLPHSTFTSTDWSKLDSTEHPGETGASTWREVTSGDLRIRLVDYGAGYLADHWCDRGHVLFVVEGELNVDLRDGRGFALRSGMSFHVSDFGDAAHRVWTKTGSRVFIVD